MKIFILKILPLVEEKKDVSKSNINTFINHMTTPISYLQIKA